MWHVSVRSRGRRCLTKPPPSCCPNARGGRSWALDHPLGALDEASGLLLGSIGVLVFATATGVAPHCLNHAGVTPRFRALLFGAEDLAADLGIKARDETGAEFALLPQSA